jgi:hypothetical protein
MKRMVSTCYVSAHDPLIRLASDTVLLQLQALFGPMLTSALHLVDKRDGQLYWP